MSRFSRNGDLEEEESRPTGVWLGECPAERSLMSGQHSQDLTVCGGGGGEEGERGNFAG